MSDSMEHLKYAVDRSNADTPDELIEYANQLYLGNPAHDAFVHGAGSTRELIERTIDELISRYKSEKKEVQECSIDNCEYDMDHRDHIHEETMIVGRLQAMKELQEKISEDSNRKNGDSGAE